MRTNFQSPIPRDKTWCDRKYDQLIVSQEREAIINKNNFGNMSQEIRIQAEQHFG